MPDGVIDITKPNTSQTMADVIASARDIGVQADTHVKNTDTAHGLAAILASMTDYGIHKANAANAHGIDVTNARVAANQAEIQAARGTRPALGARLSVSLQADGALKLTSLASRWIDNGDIPTYVSALSFTVPGDRTKVYISGVIVRATVSTGFVYGIVAAATFASPNTTITFVSDYPVLSAPISKVEIALLAFDNAIEQAVAQNAVSILSLQSQMAGLSYLGLGAYGTLCYGGDVVTYDNDVVNN